MKLSLKIELFFLMLLVGIIHTYVLYKVMGVASLKHCLSISVTFFILNFLVAYWFYIKNKTLEADNCLLHSQLETDKLTGLFNRSAFDSDIEKINQEEAYAMIFIDIDNFRDFNNTFGHPIGDDILKDVSSTIKRNVRVGDRVYRYGGEEIVVILNNCDNANAYKVAEKIRSKVSGIDNSPFPPITVSLGVSSYPEDGSHVQQIIEACDKALLAAKSQGKNRTLKYEPPADSPSI